MRHIVWLAGCLLVFSCTVNNDNLNLDAGGTGGVIGTGGVSSTGGVIGTGGVSSTGGVIGTGGVGGSGAVGSGGVGGCPRCVGTGGTSATGGQFGTGGQTATGGTTGTGGSATGGHGAGGNGTGNGGHGGNAGSSGARTCSMLESDYNAALMAAKKCTPGETNQCQALADSSLSCPGCKQFVNDTTALSAIQTEWDNQSCSSVPHACPAIACLVPTASVCSSSGSGSGTCVNAQLTPAN